MIGELYIEILAMAKPEDDPIILQISGDSAESESESGCGTGREVDWSCIERWDLRGQCCTKALE